MILFRCKSTDKLLLAERRSSEFLPGVTPRPRRCGGDHGARYGLTTVIRCRLRYTRTSAFDDQPATLIVECREKLKLVGLAFVMIDEERRLVRCDHQPDFFH
jgi:hypothetical protein